ncbi:MAG: imidazolonepropionase [Fimbriimonadales bacterium]|nr:MAG: imidazolonepropionase [Fimbriimonadales bacterium]
MKTILVGPIRELHTLAGSGGARRRAEMRETARLQNAALVIAGGRVREVGPWSVLRRAHKEAERVSVEGDLVTPGLVDCHTHLIWAGNRSEEFLRRCSGVSYQRIAREGGGIATTMRAVAEATEAELAANTVTRAKLLLELGTTTVEIKASYADRPEYWLKELNALTKARRKIKQRTVVTFMGAHVVPPGWKRQAWIREIVRFLPTAATHLCKPAFQDVFCEEGAFSVEESVRVLRAGLRVGLGAKIHCDEFHALGGVQAACRLGAVSCDHLLVSGRKEWAALATSETVAVVMPGTAFFLDKPYARARKMVDAGCAVALGSDFNPGSSMVPSMTFAMGLAVSRMGLAPEEALVAATVNSAAALRGAVREGVGTLAPGAPADFCAWPVGSLSELIYSYAFVRPTQVFLRGRQVLPS